MNMISISTMCSTWRELKLPEIQSEMDQTATDLANRKDESGKISIFSRFRQIFFSRFRQIFFFWILKFFEISSNFFFGFKIFSKFRQIFFLDFKFFRNFVKFFFLILNFFEISSNLFLDFKIFRNFVKFFEISSNFFFWFLKILWNIFVCIPPFFRTNKTKIWRPKWFFWTMSFIPF